MPAAVAHYEGDYVLDIEPGQPPGPFGQVSRVSGNPFVPSLNGDFVLRTSGVERGRIKADGTTTGVFTGGAGGGVNSVTAGDASIVVAGTATNPTVKTATLDQVAAVHPPVADWDNNGHKITGLANGSAVSDAAAFGQIPTALPPNGAAGGDLAGTYPNPTIGAGKAVKSFNGRTDAVVPVSGDYAGVVATALTGAVQAFRHVGGTTSGAPVSGTFAAGDVVVAQDGHLFVCTAPGTPGTWVDVAGAAGSVTSVFSRTGAVVAAAGDYTAAQVTNAADKASASTQAFTGSVSTGGATGAFGQTGVIIQAAGTIWAGATPSGSSLFVGSVTGDSERRIGITAGGQVLFGPGNAATDCTLERSAANTLRATNTGILSSSPTIGVGYGTGAGGAISQGTSRTTGVTLSKVTGLITLFSVAGSATWATFTVTNTVVAATDTIIVEQATGANTYNVIVSGVAAGSFKISVSAVVGTAVEAPTIRFTVIKSVSA